MFFYKCVFGAKRDWLLSATAAAVLNGVFKNTLASGSTLCRPAGSGVPWPQVMTGTRGEIW